MNDHYELSILTHFRKSPSIGQVTLIDVILKTRILTAQTT